MKELRIEFTGRINGKAKVYLTKEQHEKRMNGLIQFIASFASEIEYIIIKPKRKFKTKIIRSEGMASIIRRPPTRCRIGKERKT